MHRSPAGKRLQLTERDFAIFEALQRYRYLRSTYLHAFAGGASQARFKERLGDLFHEGYLERPAAQWRFAGACHAPLVYELGKDAADALFDLGRDSDARCVLLGARPHRQFLHGVMICAIVASIELAARSDPKLQFIPLPEILARAPSAVREARLPLQIPFGPVGGAHIIPDALFGLKYLSHDKGFYRFFALEADRGTMPLRRNRLQQTSYLAKLAAYTDLIASDGHRRHLGIPNLLVMTVMTSERRKQVALDALQASQLGQIFLFQAVNSLMTPQDALLQAAWERPGHPPLQLTRR